MMILQPGRKLPLSVYTTISLMMTLKNWWSYNEKFLKYYNLLAIYNSDDILENVRERIFVRSIVVSMYTNSWDYTQKRRHFFTDSFHQRYLKKCLLTVYKLSTQKMLEKNSFPDKNHTFWAHFMILCAKHQIGHRYTGTYLVAISPFP